MLAELVLNMHYLPEVFDSEGHAMSRSLEEGYSWERLHSPEAWTQALDYSVADVVLLATFLIITMFGLFSRKKSIHSSNEASLES